jgi:cytochrome c2
LWAVPMQWRRRAGTLARNARFRSAWETVSAPAAAWLIHAAAIWVWHVPGLYQATLYSELMHTLQHVSFMGSALLFWWALVHHRQARMSYGASVIYLFTTAMHTGGLGALLTFAGTPWYADYHATAPLWGFSALEDQQLAGLIMWVPAGISYLIAALWMMAAWLRESDRSSARWRAAALGTTSLVILLVGACGIGPEDQTAQRAAALTGGDPEQGRIKIQQYGCSSCHTIPGVQGADRKVGPPLGGIASRMYIAGILPNDPESMKQWIMNPPAFDPKTAMPNLGVSAKDASDIAAYLYTLD